MLVPFLSALGQDHQSLKDVLQAKGNAFLRGAASTPVPNPRAGQERAWGPASPLSPNTSHLGSECTGLLFLLGGGHTARRL